MAWLSQVSFEPPLVMADAGAASIIGRTGTFAANALAEDQLDIGKAMFRSTTVDGDLVNGFRFERSETGCPLLVDTPYWFECRVTDTISRGDRTVFVAEVIDAGVRDAERAPMLLRSTGMNYGG